MSVRSDSVRVLCAKPKHDDDLVEPLIADEVSQQTMSWAENSYFYTLQVLKNKYYQNV